MPRSIGWVPTNEGPLAFWSMNSSLREALAGALGASVVASSPVGGGDVSVAYRVTLVDGTTVFAKTHADPPTNFFTAEAAGLRWLREAGAVEVPEVLAVSDAPAFIVLEWIEEGRGASSTEVEFGRQLAALHRAGAPVFGREDNRPTGSLSLPNEPADTWALFYGRRRLIPLAERAQQAQAIDGDAITGLYRLADRLDEIGGPAESPARLHGDLWAGNRLIDDSGANWLVDPAAHGGHREFDLAMMRLFGGFGRDAYAAYREVFPLAEGWEDRVQLHQIAPLVVHAIKFGGSYAGAAAAAIARYI